MPRKSRRRKWRSRCLRPAFIELSDEKALEEQELLRYESLCSKIGTSLAGRRKPPDEEIIEKLRRQRNEN